ncbi:MAG: hypothetical protein M5T61_10430 [Acidimicrobiia bacterium]|nr:hypothetical protein [Acidimicrobiia bacterium]
MTSARPLTLHEWADNMRAGTQGADDMAGAQIGRRRFGLQLFAPQGGSGASVISSGLARDGAGGHVDHDVPGRLLSDAELALVGFVGTMGTVPDEKTLTMMLQDEQFVSGAHIVVGAGGDVPAGDGHGVQGGRRSGDGSGGRVSAAGRGVPPTCRRTCRRRGRRRRTRLLDLLIEKGGRVPKEARTNVSAPGAPETSTALDNIIQRAEKTKIPVVVKVSSPGAEEAIGRFRDLKTALSNVGDAIPTAAQAFGKLQSEVKSAVMKQSPR